MDWYSYTLIDVNFTVFSIIGDIEPRKVCLRKVFPDMDHRGLLIVVIFCYSFIPIVLARSRGAPDEACASITPSHAGNTFKDPTTLPYSISVDPGCSTILIQGTVNFKGFLLKAVNERNETIGQFFVTNERTRLACGGQALTHSAKLDVSQIGLRWDSGGFSGLVYFQGTIVKDYSNFWSIRSSSCDTRTLLPATTTTTTAAATTTTTTGSTTTTTAGSTTTTAGSTTTTAGSTTTTAGSTTTTAGSTTTTAGSTTTTTGSTTTTTAIATATTTTTAVPTATTTATATTTTFSLASSLSPSLLHCDGCNTSTAPVKTTTEGPSTTPIQDFRPQQSCPPKGKCFQCPDSNCVITWEQEAKDYVDFQISAYVRSDNRYIALAFSYDEEMGNDSVVLCWKEGSSYLAKVGFTEEDNIRETSDPLESLDVNKTKGVYEDNYMSCKFSKRIGRGVSNSPQVYYLNESTYNLLFVTGMMSSDGPLKYERKTYSTTKFNFTDFETNMPLSSGLKYMESCPVNAGCFMCPDGKCVINWNRKDNEYETFQISAPVADETSYLAMGFSKDGKMDNSSITGCYKSGNSFTAKMWYSPGYFVNPAPIPFESLDPSSIVGTYSNGRMSCAFSKQIERPKGSNNSVYYLNDQLYYLLFATGPMVGDTPQRHSDKSFSSSALNLTDTSTVSIGDTSSNSLIKAHGILMVIAWLMIASVSILLPRYFKSAWPDKKILNKPIWFLVHQILMVFVFLLTAIAFIIIFCEVRGYVQQDDEPTTRAHAPIGIIIMILVVLNPVMALVRCNPEHKYRWVFNYFHTFVGEFVLILAVINIFLSFFMSQANIGYWVVWVMVALVCWHALIEFLLIMHQRYLQSKALRLTGDTIKSHVTANLIKLFPGPQTFLIFAQWVGVTGLAIAICVGIGTA